MLCLNYDGIYGINNINKFLQSNNVNPSINWGVLSYKVGDPVLFNESNRFAPLVYNNLKGKILQIEEEEDCIYFTIEVYTVLNELDVIGFDLELKESVTDETSVIRFKVGRGGDGMTIMIMWKMWCPFRWHTPFLFIRLKVWSMSL